MCGICGEISFGSITVNPLETKKMMNTLHHRGPDGEGSYFEENLALGHRRLSIIDLTHSGDQPIWSADGNFCIVYNGEVYNYREIRKELEILGFKFRSNTDTEVVVNAIQHWGLETALSRFIGMFAFAVWNKAERLLFLCRDRVGVKPLYYLKREDRMVFASEMKSIRAHSSSEKEIDPIALGQFFVTGYSMGEHTIFRNVHKLLPGHYLEIGIDGNERIGKYWNVNEFQRNGDSYKGFEEAAEYLEDLLTSAFSYRLVADVPVGLFLSGGIDSSILAAILKKKVGADIFSLTIGFPEDRFNEVPKAESVNSQLGTRGLSKYLDMNEAKDILLKFPEIYDEPFGDTSGIPTYLVCREAVQHVKVALSADGGDEQFCGYGSYPQYDQYFRFKQKIPQFLSIPLNFFLTKLFPYRFLFSFLKGSGLPFAQKYNQVIASFEKMLRLFKINTLGELIVLMNEKAWTQDSLVNLFEINGENIFSNTVFSEIHANYDSQNLIDVMMRTDYSAFLRDDILTKVDRASMAVSLECRDPMLDHRIAEFAFQLPLDYHMKNGQLKRILKHILSQWISGDIVNAPKKGFMIPLYSWLRGEWKPVVMDFLSKDSVKKIGVLNEETVEKELENFFKFNGLRAEKIWMMLNFQMWAYKWL